MKFNQIVQISNKYVKTNAHVAIAMYDFLHFLVIFFLDGAKMF